MRRPSSLLLHLGVLAVLFGSALIIHDGLHKNFRQQSKSRSGKQRPLPGILIDQPFPTQRNIFFIESSCALDNSTLEIEDGDTGVRLTPRMACVIESAARAHPYRPIYVIHTCPVQISEGRDSPPHAIAALRKNNVRLWPVRFEKMFAGSPLENWTTNGDLQHSSFPVTHASDVIRFFLLWKYGGTYLDMDILMLRSTGKRRNYACTETSVTVAGGVMHLDLDEVGRRYAAACLQELMENFRGDLWSHNGAGVIVRVMQKICRSKTMIPSLMTPVRCGGFRLLPKESFYVVPRSKCKFLLKIAGSHSVQNVLDWSRTVGVHIWNQDMGTIPANIKTRQLLSVLARRVCPSVVSMLDDTL